MKKYADRGGCYPPKQKAEAANNLRDLHNSSYHTKAEFNNCFIIYSNIFKNFKKAKIYFVELCNNCKVDNIQEYSLQILINHAKLENK